MIETSIPQVVAQKIADQRKNKKVPVSLKLLASKTAGYTLEITDNGKTNKTTLSLKDGKFDYEKLAFIAATLKRQHTDVFRIDFEPRQDISYDEIVLTMDTLRRLPKGEKVAFKDDKTGESVETDLMFPDVTFTNVLGGS